MPVFGAAKAALLASALVAGLGTAAIALTPAQPDQASTAPPASIPNDQPSPPDFASAPPPIDEQIPDSTPDFVPPSQVIAPNTATPVPEPASFLILALGGTLATLCRRRR